MRKLKLLIVLCCLLAALRLSAQQQITGVPVIGQPCPAFTLHNIDNYSSKEVNTNDLKGKNVILSFWSKNCSGCVAAFPKFSKLQEEFKNRGLEIIMVAWDEPLVHPLWETYKRKLYLKMANAFDTTLFKQMKIEYSGINVWIDKNGIVKAVNLDKDVNAENISAFVAEKDFVSTVDYSVAGQERLKMIYDPHKPMFINGNGGADTAYDFRSLISVWHKGMSSNFWELSSFIRSQDLSKEKGYYRQEYPFMNVDINSLYAVACGDIRTYGADGNLSVVGRPAQIEVKDTNRYKELNKNTYNYALYLPPSRLTKENVMRAMQHNLEDYFGYKGSIEYRELPCLNLVIADARLAKQKLKVKDSIPFYVTPSAVSLYNISMENFCPALALYLHASPRAIIVDSSGITSNISIQLKDVVMSDWHDIQRALKEYGLDLIPSTLHIKTLVIKDVE